MFTLSDQKKFTSTLIHPSDYEQWLGLGWDREVILKLSWIDSPVAVPNCQRN